MIPTHPYFVLILFSFLSSSHAAPSSSSKFFSPPITYGSSSVFVEDKALYVQGGIFSTRDSSTGTFALSLNSSWSIRYPTITKLQDGIPTFYSPGTLLNDGITWLNIRSSSQAASYNIQAGISTPSPTISAFNNLVGLRAVTDAATGDVIIPNGYSSINNTSTNTMRYSPSTSTATPLLQPPDLNNLTFYAIAWSSSARAAFMFGGYYPLTQSDTASLYRLDSGATAWTKVETTGGPTARESACMVPANNGTKLIVFGGLRAPSTFLGDISIFDVTTSTWAKGQDGGETRARTGHVCAVSGDKFVTWGGEGALTLSNPSNVEVVSVYSMATNTWLDQYVVPGSEVPPPPSDPVPEPLALGPNIPVVAGACGAGLVVITGLLIWIYRRREARVRAAASLIYAQPSAPQDMEDGGSSLEEVPLSTIVQEKAKEAKNSSNNPQWGAMDLDAMDLNVYQEGSQLRSPQSYLNEGFRAPHSVQADLLQRQAYQWPGRTPESEEIQLLQMQIERERLLSQPTSSTSSASSTNNTVVSSPPSPLHIPEILSQILPLLSQLDLRFGASLVCKDWYRISLPLIEWTTHWTNVLTSEEWDTTLSQLSSKTTRLVCLSKSYQIRYFMTINLAQFHESWETLHKALEQLHAEDKLLLQQVIINGPVHLRSYLNPMLPYFQGITSLRLERVRTDEISLGAFFVYCPQLRSLSIDCDEQSQPIIKFGAGEVMPEEGKPLPLWSLTIKDVIISHANLLSIVTRSPELRELHAERLISLRASIHPPYDKEYFVHRNPILEALANSCPKLDSLHLSVRPISRQSTVNTTPPNDWWRQELGRFPQLRAYSFPGREARMATFPLLYDLQNHLTTLEIVGPKLTRTQEIQNRASNELWTFVSVALHTYLCKSTNLLHLKAGGVRYFADYFNAIRKVDYDGRITQTGCMDCRPGSNNKIEIGSDEDDNGWMSGVWACRNLQTLDIKLAEKDREGEQHESELKSRMMFGYLTLVCPRLQKVSIKRQIIHFNKEGGLCLVSRWNELQQLRLSAKKYIFGVCSSREGPITMTSCSDWGWLQRSSNWEGHFAEAGGIRLLQPTGSWTGSRDLCLPSLEKIEIHQSIVDRENMNLYDVKTELARIRPEVLVIETRSSGPTPSSKHLPPEILIHISSFLDPKSVHAAGKTCHQWHAAFQQHQPVQYTVCWLQDITDPEMDRTLAFMPYLPQRLSLFIPHKESCSEILLYQCHHSRDEIETRMAAIQAAKVAQKPHPMLHRLTALDFSNQTVPSSSSLTQKQVRYRCVAMLKMSPLSQLTQLSLKDVYMAPVSMIVEKCLQLRELSISFSVMGAVAWDEDQCGEGSLAESSSSAANVKIGFHSLIKWLGHFPGLHTLRLQSMRLTGNNPMYTVLDMIQAQFYSHIGTACPELRSFHISFDLVRRQQPLAIDDLQVRFACLQELSLGSADLSQTWANMLSQLFDWIHVSSLLTSFEITPSKHGPSRGGQHVDLLHVYLCSESARRLRHLRVKGIYFPAEYMSQSPPRAPSMPPGVWTCRQLETLHIRLESMRNEEATARQARQMFGYLSRVCPELRELWMARRTLYLGFNSGLCLLTRMHKLETLTI
ncbi:hypothetical protein BGZ82_008154, partial [Podila clonocystis]